MSSGPVGLVVGPASDRGRGRRVGREVHALLRARGATVLDLTGPSAAASSQAAGDAVTSGAIERLVVVGGDGMTHLGVRAVAGSAVPLGIVAAGTGNDIARELGLPVGDPVAAVERVLTGSPRAVDAVRWASDDGSRGWFAGVLAGGFDAVVNERANAWRWPRGSARYTLAVLRELPVFRALTYDLVIDGSDHEVSAMLVAIGNGPAYGGGMRVVPDAVMDDGLMDVLVLREVALPEFLRVFPRVFRGTHVDHPAVEVHRARQVRLAVRDDGGRRRPPVVAYADGERLAPTPVECETVSGAVLVLT